ncbi:Tetratricopeptide repeat protein [compost metagenome]
MRSGAVASAIKIFQLYVSEFPNSGNPYDSLAEAYFNNKEYALSKQNYQKALELSPDNENAKEMLVKIENETKSK